MLSKKIKNLLFGKTSKLISIKKVRSTTFIFPALDNNDIERSIRFSTDDGFILYLIKRIEKLEDKVSDLQIKK